MFAIYIRINNKMTNNQYSLGVLDIDDCIIFERDRSNLNNVIIKYLKENKLYIDDSDLEYENIEEIRYAPTPWIFNHLKEHQTYPIPQQFIGNNIIYVKTINTNKD